MHDMKNPYSDKQQMIGALVEIKRNLTPYPFPYINGYVSTLGGESRSSIMLTVSLQPKEQWKYGIMENSAYAHISIGHDGAMEMFSGCIKPKLRKTHVSGINEVIIKLHVWAEKALQTEV
jgi:hypothetical protein